MAKQYVTSQGETWDQIAFEIFGDESYMKELIEANPDYTGVFSFEGGILLDIPDITGNEIDDALPFWRTQTDEEMDEAEEGVDEYADDDEDEDEDEEDEEEEDEDEDDSEEDEDE